MTETRKVALITAAAGVGIGAAIAERLAADGYAVVVTDAHERRCHESAAALSERHGRDFLSVPLDVTSEEGVQAAIAAVMARHGRLDVLINNAGWNKLEPVAEMSLDTWQKCLAVDLTGTFLCTRYALPHMIAAGSGAIVNISSIAAYETSTVHGAAYSAAKAGVLALTRVTAAENGPHGIRANAVTPGLIYNDFLRKIYPDEFFAGYAETQSKVGRIGQPEDVAGIVAFLASEQAGYVTGEVYGVSGGVHPHG